MVISSYQINNVLRVYGDQLRHNRLTNRPKLSDSRSPDRLSISGEAKRKAVVDKVVSNILDKISQYGPQENVEKEVFKKLENEYGSQLSILKEGPDDLIFKLIDENGEMTKSLSIEDSKFLWDKLTKIAKETVDKSMM